MWCRTYERLRKQAYELRRAPTEPSNPKPPDAVARLAVGPVENLSDRQDAKIGWLLFVAENLDQFSEGCRVVLLGQGFQLD
jgi:hypothetical protein